MWVFRKIDGEEMGKIKKEKGRREEEKGGYENKNRKEKKNKNGKRRRRKKDVTFLQITFVHKSKKKLFQTWK